jgi:hypothetical protein
LVELAELLVIIKIFLLRSYRIMKLSLPMTWLLFTSLIS